MEREYRDEPLPNQSMDELEPDSAGQLHSQEAGAPESQSLESPPESGGVPTANEAPALLAVRTLQVAPLRTISYLRSYTFIFDNDQWPVSVIAGALCVLVSQVLPIVPYIVFGGYLLIVIESLVESPESNYPEFQFDRLVDYLGKAIWSFLVSLPFILIFFLLYLGSYFASMFGLIALVNTQDAETIGLSLSIGLPVYFFTILAFVASCSIVAMAMMLRAGLTESFTEAFRFRWIFDFIRRNWVEHFLVFTFFTLTSMALSILGLAFFCVGTFAASAMSLMALANLMAQLYRLHVSRGGQVIQKAPAKLEANEPAVANA